jgi:hypothetical protein
MMNTVANRISIAAECDELEERIAESKHAGMLREEVAALELRLELLTQDLAEMREED